MRIPQVFAPARSERRFFRVTVLVWSIVITRDDSTSNQSLEKRGVLTESSTTHRRLSLSRRVTLTLKKGWQMLIATENETDRAEHPVDVVEQLAATNDWSFDRDDEDEISISVAGAWTDYHVAFTWLPTLKPSMSVAPSTLKRPGAAQSESMRSSPRSTNNVDRPLRHLAEEGVSCTVTGYPRGRGAAVGDQCAALLDNALRPASALPGVPIRAVGRKKRRRPRRRHFRDKGEA